MKEGNGLTVNERKDVIAFNNSFNADDEAKVIETKDAKSMARSAKNDIISDKTAKSDGSIHKGHRERVRNKFFANGCSLNGFYEHQVLEMLLFFSHVRTDVNPLAHKILNHFGSLSAILNAGVNELINFGLSPNTAMLIKLVNAIPAYSEEMQYQNAVFTSVDSVMDFTCTLLKNHSDERICVLCLNADRKLLHYEYINIGLPDKTEFPFRRAVEIALNHKAVNIVIAHNHPSKSEEPSSQDISCTKAIDVMLHGLGIKLLEHIIVAYPYCYAIKKGYTYDARKRTLPTSIDDI